MGIPYVVAMGLALLGVVLLAVGARGPWLPAIGGGVMLGMAAATALSAAGLHPLGRQTPAAVLLIGLLIGLAAILAGRATRIDAGPRRRSQNRGN